MKSALIATTVIFLGASGAYAADAVQYEEPAAPIIEAPVFSWTGGYLGGQIGYGWGKSEFSDGFDSLRVKPDGFLGGLYAGYNFDVGNNVILGIDGDVTYNNLKDSYSVGDGEFGADVESKLRWSGAVRARAGVALDRFLPYIAGGVAFGSVKNTLSASDGFDTISTSQSKTLTGWTAGAGVDYAATDNLIVRLEYRYTDYGHKDFDFGTDDLVSVRDKFKTNEVRLGIAYKF
jgi:outer membrane immunogenic protein